MPPQDYAVALFSSLFRLSAYVFLRVVPGRIIAAKIMPTLFALYVTSLRFASKQVQVEKEQSNSDQKSAEKSVATPPPTGRSSPLTTLLFSLPTSVKHLQVTNLSINILLLAASIEYVSHAFIDDASDVIFTRVGAVYHDAAKVVVRYPAIPEALNETIISNQVRIMWREQDQTLKPDVEENVWKAGPELDLALEQDWIATGKISGLWPSTKYEYRLSATNGTFLPYPTHPISFRTFPDPHLPTGNYFRFIVTSCMTTNFPYRPFGGTRIRGMDLLAEYLSAERASARLVHEVQENATETNTTSIEDEVSPSTDFMLFLGDFIYADVPIYRGNDREAYRKLYRRNYKSKSARKVYEQLPIIHAYDDHEIINNYAGEGLDTEPFPSAADAFNIYNGNANYDNATPGKNYYDFRHGDTAFFVMDTRRYRTKIPSGGSEDSDDLLSGMERTMLGSEQLEAFFSWLTRVNSTAAFKFVVTSVPFTSLWQHDAQVDSWPGYAMEKAVLLDAMQTVSNVILLSGDRHEFAAIEFNGPVNNKNIIREFSTSPLSMFYIPFFRTLKMESDEKVQRVTIEDVVNEDGETETVDTVENVPREKVIKYIAQGNYKWSTFEVDTRDPKKPTLRMEVIIDGHQAHQFEMVGSPVELSKSRAIALLEGGLRNLKQFVNPGRWF